jgi:formate dehydrogenase subunit gamma
MNKQRATMPEEATQSASPGPLPGDLQAVLQAVLSEHAKQSGALLPILHGVQDALGYVPSKAVPLIADALNLSRAEVHGVVTYYHHFREHPPGRCVVQVCRAEACQAMGADALWTHAQGRLGCAAHGTSADGAFSLEPVYCLGLCASSPAVVMGDEVHARVTPKSFDALVAQARSAA